MHLKRGVTPPYFKKLKLMNGSRETEFLRVPGLMSESLTHPVTIEFLDDLTDSKVG